MICKGVIKIILMKRAKIHIIDQGNFTEEMLKSSIKKEMFQPYQYMEKEISLRKNMKQRKKRRKRKQRSNRKET